jgi:MFS family permease
MSGFAEEVDDGSQRSLLSSISSADKRSRHSSSRDSGRREKKYGHQVFSAGWGYSASEVSEVVNDADEEVDDDVRPPVVIHFANTAMVTDTKRFVLLGCAVFFSLTLSGVVFGWPAVVIMLQDQGVYQYLCEPGATLPCQAQILRFNLVFVVASTGFACAVLPMGIVLDRWGPKICSCMGSVLLVAGSIMFAFADPPHFDGFLPGYLLMGLGGPPVVFSCMHLANLFPQKKGTIITLLNVALDASSLVFVIMGDIYRAAPQLFRYKVMFLGFAALPALSLIVALVLWPMRAYVAVAPPDVHIQHTSAEVKEDSSFKEQVTSLVFWLCATFTTLNLFRVNYYIATVGGQMLEFTSDVLPLANATMTENQVKAELFTSIFAYFLPIVGVLSFPMIGFLLDRLGLYLSIWILVASGIVYGILSVLTFVPIEVQLITFIFVAFFRALLFSAMATYVAAAFAFQHFGKLWGVVFLFGGIVNLAEYFLSAAVNGNYFWLNVGMLVASVVMAIFPLYLRKHPPPQTVVTVH